MSDVSGAAEAAPASEAAPAPQALPEKPASSPREAMDRAFASVKIEPEDRAPRPIQSTTQTEEKPPAKAETKPKAVESKPTAKAEPKAGAAVESKPEAKAAPSRGPDGKFAAREGAEGEGAEAVSSPESAPRPSSFPEAPSRFSGDAKAAWNDAPEAVRAEVHRATKELEQGLQKYKGDAEAFDKVRQFDELAKKSGTTLDAAMARYVGIEQRLRSDFIGGLEEICANRGVSLRDVAARILGAKPEQAASRQDQTIASLRQTVLQLQQQIGGVTKTIEQQQTQGAMSHVADFASQPGHERFEELAPDIEFFLKNGRAADLKEAYSLAERLNPGMPAAPAVATPAVEPAAQPRKANLSVHGAPSSGSDPATRKPPSSAQDAVGRAFASLGIG